MKRLALALAATLVLAAPIAAQTMDLLLPSLSFPEDTVSPSTKGCDATAPSCQAQE